MAVENIVEVFDGWFKHYTEVINQLTDMEESLKTSTAHIETLAKANVRLQNDCSMLQETVSQCQQQLHIVCDLEDDVRCLKQQIADKDHTLESESAQNKAAIENIKKAHETEKESALTNMKAEYDKKLTDINYLLGEEMRAKSLLQVHIEDIKRDKDKELSRITMEYESKLTKAHRQKAQYMEHQQQVLNQDILRKKMQHMKENYEQEIAALKSQIQDMRHMLESIHPGKPMNHNRVQFSEQQPQKPLPQEAQQQKIQKQRQKAQTSQQEHRNASKYNTVSASKLRY